MKRFIKSAIACVAAVAMIATVAPVTAQAAKKAPAARTVTTQEQLEKAIDDGVTNITIKTSKKIKIVIPADKKAAKVTFKVNAKNATITNKATAKGLTIVNAKAFTESGKNNKITVATNKKLNLTVAKASKGADIKVAAEGADLKIVANGTVKSVAVAKSDANVVINGTSKSKIDVTISKPGAKVSTSVPVDLTANRKATVVIAKGADNSTVTANASLKVSVAKGATVASVDVKADANVSLIAKGTVADVTVAKEAEGANLSINASGKVENVTIDAKADVAVKGSTDETVKVTVNAADTTVKAETKVDTTLNADAKLDFAAGAEGSKVTAGNEDVKADITNGTSESITTVDSTGKESSVESGKSETTTEDKPAAGGGSTNTGTSSGSGSGQSPYGKTNPHYIKIAKVEKDKNKEQWVWNTYKSGDKIEVTNNYYGYYSDLVELIKKSYDDDVQVGDTVTYPNETTPVSPSAVVISRSDDHATLLYTGGKTNDYRMEITWVSGIEGYEITWDKNSKTVDPWYSKKAPTYIAIAKEGGKTEFYQEGDNNIDVNGKKGTYKDLLGVIKQGLEEDVKEVTYKPEGSKETYTAQVTEPVKTTATGAEATLSYTGKTNIYTAHIVWVEAKYAYEITWSSKPRQASAE